MTATAEQVNLINRAGRHGSTIKPGQWCYYWLGRSSSGRVIRSAAVRRDSGMLDSRVCRVESVKSAVRLWQAIADTV